MKTFAYWLVAFPLLCLAVAAAIGLWWGLLVGFASFCGHLFGMKHL